MIIVVVQADRDEDPQAEGQETIAACDLEAGNALLDEIDPDGDVSSLSCYEIAGTTCDMDECPSGPDVVVVANVEGERPRVMGLCNRHAECLRVASKIRSPRPDNDPISADEVDRLYAELERDRSRG